VAAASAEGLYQGKHPCLRVQGTGDAWKGKNNILTEMNNNTINININNTSKTNTTNDNY
jgi:hypothetical protein